MTAAQDPITTLTVDLGTRSYDILIGDGLLAEAGRHIRPVLSQPRVMIVTDSNVARHALPPVEAALRDAGIAHETIILPAGEGTKDFKHLEEVVTRVLEAGIDRKSTMLALGGGVIGDLAGFAAAVALRGIDFIQVPTSLLAQVDSSVGGKTGINAPQGKNLVGAFHQPRLVLADTGVLDSLPPRELRAGYAEVVKYGCINQPDFFTWLETNGGKVLAGDRAARRHAIRVSCEAKAAVVADDEREQGSRALLNLGHTFGHALERETGYGDTLLHGEAVAIGMVMAFDLSVRLGLCPKEDLERLRTHLIATGLPHDLSSLPSTEWTAERLIGHMAKDKKAEAGRLTFILARGIGKSFVTRDVETADVAATLNGFLG